MMYRSFRYFCLLLLKLSIEKDSYVEFFYSKIKGGFIDVILGEAVKLVVGTAGWRQKYGVTQEGPIDSKSIENLVQNAKTNGIEWIDTASRSRVTERGSCDRHCAAKQTYARRRTRSARRISR